MKYPESYKCMRHQWHGCLLNTERRKPPTELKQEANVSGSTLIAYSILERKRKLGYFYGPSSGLGLYHHLCNVLILTRESQQPNREMVLVRQFLIATPSPVTLESRVAGETSSPTLSLAQRGRCPLCAPSIQPFMLPNSSSLFGYSFY